MIRVVSSAAFRLPFVFSGYELSVLMLVVLQQLGSHQDSVVSSFSFLLCASKRRNQVNVDAECEDRCGQSV